MGIPSVFVRTTGCNLRCWFCDTDYTSWHPEGEQLAVPDIVARVSKFGARHVVVTGGEPMIAGDIGDLCSALHERGLHITIETAATVFKPVVCDLASLSPKLSNSTPWEREGGRFALRHDQRRLNYEVIRAFLDRYTCQLKFVIDRPSDLDEVLNVLEHLSKVDQTQVLLMPQGTTPEAMRERGLWLVEECKRYGFRYCPRTHIELFGNRRGT